MKQRLLRLLLPATFLLQFLNAGKAQTIHPKLDSMLRHTLDSMHTLLNAKGIGAAVEISTGAVWADGAGVSTENPTLPIHSNHAFGIGSVNKTITAGCILQLADEGLLSLGDSLHEWLDTFDFINPNITIRQLLRHQSGIYDVISNPDYFPLIEAYPDSTWALDDVIRTLIQPPNFQPGLGWSYSNTNYLLLGLIIESVTGNPYYEECRNRFLEPLGLNSMAMPPFDAFPPSVAHVWLDLNGDNQVEDADFLFGDWDAWYSSAGPAGAYFSTPADIAHWMRAYMSGTLLSPAMMTEMKTTVTTPFPGATKYGLGIMERNILNQKAFGHGGDAGYSASVWYFPNKDISISVLNNDGRKNSWTLIPTVAALLKTYLDFEQLVSGNADIGPDDSDINAFPNPFSGELNLTVTLPVGISEARFALFNALGEKVAEAGRTIVENGETSFKFDRLSGLPAGMYFLSSVLDGKTAPVRKVLCKAR